MRSPSTTSRSKRAVSAVIGGIIIFGIIFSTVTAFYIYQMNSKTQLALETGQAEEYSLQASSEQFSLNGTIRGAVYALNKVLLGGQLYVNVNNTGPIPINISAIIVLNQTGNNVLSVNSSIPSSIRTINTGSNQTYSTGMTYTPGTILLIKVLTARGSSRIAVYPPVTANSPLTQVKGHDPFGDIFLHFSSYSYYLVTSSGCNPPGPKGKNSIYSNYCLQYLGPAYSIPYTQIPKNDTAFAVSVINLNPNKTSIVLDANTTFLQYWSGGSAINSLGCFILSNSTQYIYNKYASYPITLTYNVSTTIVFGNGPANGNVFTPTVSFSLNKVGGGSLPGQGQLAATELFFHGWEGISTTLTPNYGQNVPFETTLYT